MNSLRKKFVKSIRVTSLNEVEASDVGDVCYTGGSTHVMRTCTIGDDKYFLKFSDEALFDDFDPSLQILVEYLAYRIYGLYSGIKIPKPILVYDKNQKKVGLATSAAPGRPALGRIDPKSLAKKLSQGVYVDVFLANWDVIGTGSGNVFHDPASDVTTRIDPGGSLTFRAQGGRKGGAFGSNVGELQTMLKGGMGAGSIYQYADLKDASKEFKAVPWNKIDSEIEKVRDEVNAELDTRNMSNLYQQWNSDVDQIKSTLAKRHAVVLEHIKFVEKSG